MARRLGGRYEIRAELGGIPPVRVYRAIDSTTGAEVLVKTMPVSPDEMSALIRFQEEAALVTALDHPNIIKVYRTFLDEGMSCIVAEPVHGEPLGQILRRERLSLGRIKAIALQIASALAHAHDRNLIHRDLEPDNILITADGTVKLRALVEMGQERVVRGAAVPASINSPRAQAYASPEQRARQTVGPRTDLYSLGALMYHMVTGHPPFDDTVPGTGVSFGDNVPDEWQILIARAMARSEQYRFHDAREMGEAIEQLPAPDAPPAQFSSPPRLVRCPKCGREGRGRFCGACGTPLPV